jgi:peroxiredoxin
MPLTVGQPAPEFSLMNQDRKPVKLSDLRGRRVVLLFYPMDFSPVCTTEHCSFGPELGAIQAGSNTVVFGINCDHPFCHEAYKKQFNIPYDLLSDTSRDTVKAYDMYWGVEPFNAAKRGTVVIDEAGNISHWSQVEIGDHRSVESIVKAARGG